MQQLGCGEQGLGAVGERHNFACLTPLFWGACEQVRGVPGADRGGRGGAEQGSALLEAHYVCAARYTFYGTKTTRCWSKSPTCVVIQTACGLLTCSDELMGPCFESRLHRCC